MVGERGWAPEPGDIVWLEFDPQAGHEQAGDRPALVLSPREYNIRTSLMLCVPLTTRVRNYPFEGAIAGARGSVALADQAKSLNWRARRAQHKGKASAQELAAIRARLIALIG